MAEVINSDGSVLLFEGELVARVSAELPEKLRWTVMELWLSTEDTWILQIVGMTRVPGEDDRYRVVITDRPEDFLGYIVGPEVSRLAKRLLAEAFSYLKNCDD